MTGFRAATLALGCAVAVGMSAPARGYDLGLFAEVDGRVAQGRLMQARMLVEAELMVARALPLDDRLDLLETLAALQGADGDAVAQGDTLAEMAQAIVEAYGSDYPDLAPILIRAGAAYMTGGETEQARDSFEAALRLDEIFLACDSPALGESYARTAEALAASGDTAAAIEARALAEDPLARCGIEVAAPVADPLAVPAVVPVAEPASVAEPVPGPEPAPALALGDGPVRPGAARHAVFTPRASGPEATPLVAALVPEPAPAPVEVTRSAPRPLLVVPPNARFDPAPVDTAEAGFAAVRLYYGTDRAASGSARPNAVYGAERGRLDLGVVDVAVPRVAKPAGAEAARLVRFGWPANATGQIAITELNRLDAPAFYAAVAADLAGQSAEDALVFVHGFNTTFAEAARTTAALAYEMNFDGVPLFYAWPSQGTARGYLADAASVRVSARRLLVFLEGLVEEAAGERIHLVAHAMGARALGEALELYAARHPEAEAVFGQVIFAAPDLDAELFTLQAQAMRRLATRITLYTNRADAHLTATHMLAGNTPRAGGDGAGPLASADFDTIDMTALGPDFLSSGDLLADVSRLTWQDAAPAARCGMEPAEAGGAWVFTPAACDAGVLLPAIALARRFGDDARDRVARDRAAALAAVTDGEGGTLAVELKALEVALGDLLTP